jgi:hypothetical protein
MIRMVAWISTLFPTTTAKLFAFADRSMCPDKHKAFHQATKISSEIVRASEEKAMEMDGGLRESSPFPSAAATMATGSRELPMNDLLSSGEESVGSQRATEHAR